MNDNAKFHPNYPTPDEIDQWCDSLKARAQKLAFTATEVTDPPCHGHTAPARHATGRFVKFEGGFDTFYCYWQPVASRGPAPLLIHLPGYGGETSSHPQLVADGFNVLHVNPRGYCTPQGLAEEKKRNGSFPVLPDHVETLGQHGYSDWFTDVLVALRWALDQPCVQPERLGVFGTSQGGGTALLLASILRDRVRAVAADVPFLINFPMLETLTEPGAYFLAFEPLTRMAATGPEKVAKAWRALGLVDVLCHAHRLGMPVMLLAGAADTICPSASIESLLPHLKGTRSYTLIDKQEHTYTVPFLPLARAWFAMHV